MPKRPLEDFAEGGVINDRRGQATRRMRQQRKGVMVETPPRPPRPRGNRTMRTFR